MDDSYWEDLLVPGTRTFKIDPRVRISEKLCPICFCPKSVCWRTEEEKRDGLYANDEGPQSSTGSP